MAGADVAVAGRSVQVRSVAPSVLAVVVRVAELLAAGRVVERDEAVVLAPASAAVPVEPIMPS